MPYKNPERRKEYRQSIKRGAIEAFGGKCVICGTSDFSKLHLTHPNGDGDQHRKLLGVRRCGEDVYFALRKRGWDTDGFKIVVMCAKHHRKHDFSGEKSPLWKPESTNPKTKYTRYYRNPEKHPMTEGDWQQLRKYELEKYHQRKGVELIAK